jgi:diguanylate cyclase (GGDEF)-like protein
MQSGPLSFGGEYLVRASEEKYRAEHLPEFLHQTQLCFQFTIFINILFVLSDWRFHGQRHFYYAIASRAIIVATSFVCITFLSKVDSYSHFQLLCLAWAGPVIAACAELVTPHTDIALLAVFILPAFFYLAVPASFRLTLLLGLSTSVATLAAYMSPHFVFRTSLGLAIGMLLSNVVLLLVFIQSNRFHRLEWAAIQAERMANEELSEHRAILQKILQAVPTPLIIVSKDGSQLLMANDAACDYFGADLLSGPIEIESYVDHRDWARLGQELQANGQVAGFEARFRLPNGFTKDVLLEATTMTVAGTKSILTVFVDITRRKEVETTLKKMANTDFLSSLPNRARFFAVAVDEIKRAARYKRPLAVFMVDIDFFKHINDTYGHQVGDLALKSFAELCRSWVRHEDVVARLGGEEFGFLLPETDAHSALTMANRLCAAVAGMKIDKLPKSMTISIGVSEIRPGETTVDAALSRADQALYEAKNAGRNRASSYDCLEIAPRCAGRR